MVLQNQRGTKAPPCYNRKVLLLHEAKEGNKAEVERLLRAGKLDVDVRDKTGKTPLMLAMEGSHDSTVEVLFQFHPNIHAKNNFGKSALHMALKLGLSRRKIIRFFLNVLKEECGCDSDQLASKLISIQCPLYYAALLKDAASMRAMLEKGCTADARDSHTLRTALHVAVDERDFKSIKVLIDNGADVNARDSNGNIPVAHYQFFDDSDEELKMLKMLTNQCTALSTLDRSGFIQIRRALKQGKKEALRIFLRCDINWYLIDKLGFCPMAYLATNNALVTNQDVLEEFRNRKIDIVQDHMCTDVIFFASSRNVTKLVEILLDHGFDPNIQNPVKCTPLFVVTRFIGSSEQVEENKKTFMLLLERGADPQINSLGDQTVFESIIDFQNFHLAEPALGQLAIEKSLGKEITDDVQKTINSHELLKDQFLLSETQLEQFKQTEICNVVNLFTLLTGCEKKLEIYARNEGFADEWKSFNDSCSNSYYALYILQQKLKKTMHFVKLRNDTSILVCNVMRIFYESFPAIVDKIVNYVIF